MLVFIIIIFVGLSFVFTFKRKSVHKFVWVSNNANFDLVYQSIDGAFSSIETVSINGKIVETRKITVFEAGAMAKKIQALKKQPGVFWEFQAGKFFIEISCRLTTTNALKDVKCKINRVPVSKPIDSLEPVSIDNSSPGIRKDSSPQNSSIENIKETHTIVERQVMVTRCKFCGQITPLDLNNCEKCGAAAFS